MKAKLIFFGFAAIAVILGEVWLIAAPQAPEQRPSIPAQARQVIPAHPSATRATSITPSVGAPNATPNLVIVSTPTTVTVAAQISAAPLAGGVNLLRLGATGTQPTILGVMHDDGLNGDATAGDGTYTLQVPFNESTAGHIQLQVSAAFPGMLRRVVSGTSAIPVYGVHSDSAVGITVEYPPTLYLASPPSGVSGQFLLQSTTQFVGLGEGFDDPDPNDTPANGYVISFTSDNYTSQPFDINAWINTMLPNYDIATITPTTVTGLSAYILTFDDAQAPKPLIVVPHGSTVYEISYNSTFDPGTTQESAGLADFNAVLSHLQFLR
jgi:hypothetical protein